MNLLDVVLATLGTLASYGGYRLGFLTRTASWIGMAIGLALGVRSLPWLFETFQEEGPANLLLLGGIVMLGASFVGQTLGLVVGSRLRIVLPGPEWAVVDRFFGAVVGLLGVVLTFWMLLPTIADIPGGFAEQARNSVLARGIDRLLPDAPDTLVALRQLVGEDQFPQVFSAITPAPDLGPPPSDPGLDAALVAAVTPATVKVSGIACNRIQEGSGFVTLGSDIVVTNAHVVAGQESTQVERDDGEMLDAIVVVFDADRDLAVLRVPGLGRDPLPLADGVPGSAGGVFGHPGGAPLRVQPFQVGQEVQASGTDIYDRHRTSRDVLVLAASLRPGDSGSALVDGTGSVVGVAFAIAPDDPDVAYALDTTEVTAVLAGSLDRAVDTGPCLR